MAELRKFLASQATSGLLPWPAQLAAAERFGTTLARVEETAPRGMSRTAAE